MFRNTRVLPVTCLITCLVTIPWTNALASERQDFTAEQAQSQPVDDSTPGNAPATPDGVTNGIRNASFFVGGLSTGDAGFSPVPRQYAMQSRGRQSVATTTERKLLLGVVAGALIVTGVAMLAYGATSTCKGLNGATTNSCDKKSVIGAMGLSGGTVMLVVWALSKP